MLESAGGQDLRFPGINRGMKASAGILSGLLYLGGAKTITSQVAGKIASGDLGSLLVYRLDLVKKIHEAILGKLVAGGSNYTAHNQIRFIRYLFAWAESHNYPLDLKSIQKTYIAWTDALMYKHQVAKKISQSSAYSMASQLGSVLDIVLERESPLISMTRLRMPPRRKTAQGVLAEKQSLSETFEFGAMLQDICDALTVDAVLKGALPLRITLRSGREIVEWSGYPFPEAIVYHQNNEPQRSPKGVKRAIHRKSIARFAKWAADGTLRTRYSLANRRIECELLMFVGQTGMNFTQAHKLKLRHFYYASYIDGYQVRDRKGRRGGDVLFEIFREYKPHFERYLEWRSELFPESDDLFPLLGKEGRSFQAFPHFALRKLCKKLNIRFVSPRELRNTRVNWLLRRSGDPDLTAELAQHAKETLLDTYERPSQQRAMTEVTRFWERHDPTLERTMAVAPGLCDGVPKPLSRIPKNATEPDCNRASGCMWCEHHRDVDSLDYLWSLACFRHLKIIEASRWTPSQGTREVHPAQHAIDRMSEKLRWFNESNARRKGWVDEALARVEEGNYHPEWMIRITAMEA